MATLYKLCMWTAALLFCAVFWFTIYKIGTRVQRLPVKEIPAWKARALKIA